MELEFGARRRSSRRRSTRRRPKHKPGKKPPKIYTGKNGGQYYRKSGRRVYIKA